MKVIKSGKQLSALIASICAMQKEVEGQIHVALVSCLYHVNEHRNTTPINDLLNGLGGSVRKNAIRAWALAFGKLEMAENGKDVAFTEREVVGSLDDAMAKPFWEFKPEQAFTPFDLDAQVRALIKKAEAAAGDERNSLNAEHLRKLRAVLSPIDAAA